MRKKLKDSPYLYWGVTAFLVLAAAIICYLLLSRLSGGFAYVRVFLRVLSPVIYGLIFAYVLYRPAKFFEKHVFRFISIKKHPRFAAMLRRTASVLVVLIITITVIVGGLWIMLPRLYNSLQSLVTNLPSYYSQALSMINGIVRENSELRDYALSFTETLSQTVTDFLTQRILGSFDTIFVAITSGILEVILTFINIIIGFIIAAYILLSREYFSAGVKKLIYAFIKPARAESFMKLTKYIDRTCGNYIFARLIDSLIVGFVTYFASLIMHLPYALLIAALIGITNIVPVFGPFMGAIPAALVLLLESPPACLAFVIYIIIIQILDGYLLMPRVQGTGIGLSGFWILFAVTIFGGLFGFWGFLFGVPAFAVIYHLLGMAVNSRLRKRSLETPPTAETTETENNGED